LLGHETKASVPDDVNKTAGGVLGRHALGPLRGCEEGELVGFASFHQPTPFGIDE
jgi:hypothetical protein